MTVRKDQGLGSAQRLTTYLVAGVGALGAAGNTQGAVIYTPGPFVANNSTIDIDFDGVGGSEFAITHQTGSTLKQTGPKTSTLKPFNQLGMGNGTGAASLGVVGTGKPARLAAGVTVSSLNTFTTLAGTFQASNLAGNLPIGAWNGGQTGFIGVRFDLGGGLRYGWIQLQTPASGLPLNTGEVLGYAYETSGGAIVTPAAVPEPNTLLLLASGALGVLALKRRKRA